jgi:hypothetical protein
MPILTLNIKISCLSRFVNTSSISISWPLSALSVCNVGCVDYFVFNVSYRVPCVDSFVLRAMAVRLSGKLKTLRGVRKVTISLKCLQCSW